MFSATQHVKDACNPRYLQCSVYDPPQSAVPELFSPCALDEATAVLNRAISCAILLKLCMNTVV